MYQVDLVAEFGHMDLIISNNVNVSSLTKYVLKSTVFIQYVLKSTVFITLVKLPTCCSCVHVNIGLSS